MALAARAWPPMTKSGSSAMTIAVTSGSAAVSVMVGRPSALGRRRSLVLQRRRGERALAASRLRRGLERGVHPLGQRPLVRQCRVRCGATAIQLLADASVALAGDPQAKTQA